MTQGTIRLLVVSSQEIVVAGVTAMLAASSSIEVRRCEGVDPEVGEVDVVLYDVLRLAGGDGAEVARLAALGKGVVALARDLRPDLAVRALELGALTVVSMGCDADDLVLAVESVHAGETADLGAPPQEWLAQSVGLSEREANILELVALGLTNAQIAGRLYLSINTVKTYIRTAYRKMGVDRRSQAVGWAMDHGFPRSGDERRDGVDRD